MMRLLNFKILIVVVSLFLSVNCGNAFENRSYITKPLTASSTSFQRFKTSIPSISQQSHYNRPMKPLLPSSGIQSSPPPPPHVVAPLPNVGNLPPVRPYYNPYKSKTIVVKDSQTGNVRYYPNSYYGYIPVSTRTTSFSSGNSSFTYTEQYVPLRHSFGSSGTTIIRFK